MKQIEFNFIFYSIENIFKYNLKLLYKNYYIFKENNVY